VHWSFVDRWFSTPTKCYTSGCGDPEYQLNVGSDGQSDLRMVVDVTAAVSGGHLSLVKRWLRGHRVAKVMMK